MAKVKIDFGAEVDILNKGELDKSLYPQQKMLAEIQESVAVRGIKYLRVPLMYSTPANGTVKIGGTAATGGGNATGGQAYPRAGYVWSVMRLGVVGLANSTGNGTADMLALYRGGDEFTGANFIAQISGNTPFITFSKLGFLCKEGERIQAVSVGSMTATVQIFINADVLECPEEMLGKIAIG